MISNVLVNIAINNSLNKSKFFNYLNNHSYSYVWLHGYNNDKLGDIDIAVDLETFKNIDKIVKNFADENSFRILQILQHEYCAKYFVLVKNLEKILEYLILDICSDYVRNGRVLIYFKDLIKNRVYENGFF